LILINPVFLDTTGGGALVLRLRLLLRQSRQQAPAQGNGNGIAQLMCDDFLVHYFSSTFYQINSIFLS